MSWPRKSLHERFDDARATAAVRERINGALTRAAYEWFSDRLGDQDVIDAFKRAWERADRNGDVGHRVEAGLAAVAEAVRKP
jgi:hypothetical protein